MYTIVQFFEPSTLSSMDRSRMPQVVVANPIKSEYYDLTLDLEKIQFSGASIFSTLEGVHQNTLRPRTVESWGNRFLRALAVKMGSWHVSRDCLTFASKPVLIRQHFSSYINAGLSGREPLDVRGVVGRVCTRWMRSHPHVCAVGIPSTPEGQVDQQT